MNRTKAIIRILAPMLLAAGAVGAAETRQIAVPAGDLVAALESISRQAGVELVFQPEQLKGVKTRGVSGKLTAYDAVRKLLEGTQLKLSTDASTGAMMIGAASASQKTGTNTAPSAQLVQLAQGSAATPQAAKDVQSSAAADGEMEVRSNRIDGLNNKGVIPVGTETPLYYNIIDRDMIDRLGATTMDELFRYIPQTQPPHLNPLQAAPGDAGTVFGSPAARTSVISMRGFNSAQTVILINGRPQPRSPIPNAQGNWGVDISRIPVAAIERIEIMPSASSALYGNGAIGGAINIILRKNYQGQDLTVFAGTSVEGGSEEFRATYLGGRSFFGGRTELTTTLSFQRRMPLMMGDRDFLDRLLDRYPSNTPIRLPSILTFGGGGSTVSAFDHFVLANLSGPRAILRLFPEAGQPADLGIPGAPGATYATVPVGTSPAASQLLTPASFSATANQVGDPTGGRFSQVSIYNPVDDYTADLQLEHRFSQKLRAFAGFTARRGEYNYTYQQPVSGGGGLLTLGPNDPLNPFRQGVTPGFQGRAVQVLVWPVDLPNPSTSDKRTNLRATLGFAGDLTANWSWSLDVTGDRNRSSNTGNNTLNFFDLVQMDADRAFTRGLVTAAQRDVMATNLAARRALYPLLADHEAFPWAGDPDTYWSNIRYNDSRTRNVNTNLRASGEILELPTGDWTVSVSAELAEYTLEAVQRGGGAPAVIALVGGTPPSSVLTPYREQNRTSKAGGFETVIPVIGRNWRPIPIEGMDINFGMRFDRTRTFGLAGPTGTATNDSTKETTTSVAGLKLSIVKDLSIRASYTEGVSPPDWGTFNNDATIQINPGTFQDPARGNTAQNIPFNVSTAGNPDLLPERAMSANVGVIFKPRWVPGLTLIADFWESKYEDRISNGVNINTAINNQAQYGFLITRGPNLPGDAPGWAGVITGYNGGPVNIGVQETKGIDVQLRYDLDMGEIGTFFFHTNSSFTNDFYTRINPLAVAPNTVGGSGPLRWRGTQMVAWSRGAMGITLVGNYTGERSTSTTAPSPSFPTANGLDGRVIPDSLTVDTQFTYTIPTGASGGLRGLAEGTKWTLGMQNVFNKRPYFLSANTVGFYDGAINPRGRYVSLQLLKSF